MKKILIGIIVLLILVAGGYLYLRRYLKSPDLSRNLRERIYQLVNEKSNGRYQLSIGDIHIDPDNQSASLRNIELLPDTLLLQDGLRYRLKLDNILLKHVDIAAILAAQQVKLNNITVSGGELEITSLGQLKEKSDTTKAPDIRESSKKILRSVKKSLNSILVDTIQLNDIDVTYFNRKHQKHLVKKIHIDLYDLAIDSAGLADTSRFFFARSINVAIDSLRLPVSDNRYLLSAEKLLVIAGSKQLTHIRGLKLQAVPTRPLETAAAQAGVQQDIYAIAIKEITATSLRFSALLEDSTISAANVLMSSPVLQVFNDKSNPPATKSKVGQYPHQLLRKFPFRLNIPLLVVENGAVTYLEKNEKGDGVGKVYFTKVNGKVGPLSGKGTGIRPFTADFDALFMGKSGMHVTFDFPPVNGHFAVTARFQSFDVRQLNEACLPLGSTALQSGKVTRLFFRVEGNDNSATAVTTLNYEGLKIAAMKGSEDEGFKKKGLLSMIANTFILHENNKPGDKFPDQTIASYRRVTTKSFFNLVWKSVFYSVKGNTGVGLKGRDKDRATIR
ncbi:hypothetical protein [Flavihumibacter petaseus]|uniref:AsmA-like C-terminal domain-containing protein n=1 Tax=Flavihumibacter petaseus NBRC 106054 TaxID=1220578 RepID=A0A0E9N190_9BACT|nr:hypothetical protein [Flavihumibacter petaseus]GAO43401.1 hypothetical protein FPE01S_02_05060 [Flavihumibacter petaseus NBRC 106054]